MHHMFAALAHLRMRPPRGVGVEWIAIAIAVAKGNRNGGAKAHIIVLLLRHICEGEAKGEPNTFNSNLIMTSLDRKFRIFSSKYSSRT